MNPYGVETTHCIGEMVGHFVKLMGIRTQIAVQFRVSCHPF